MRLILSCIFGIYLVNHGLRGDVHGAGVNDVVQELTGKWDVEAGVNQGERLSEEELDGTTMMIVGKKIVTLDKDKNEKYRATFTVDATNKPIHIDMTTQMQGVPPAKSFGILKLDGDDLAICYALPGGSRPETFESPEGSKVMLFKCKKKE